MSASFAYAQIGGSLGKDPESRATTGGTKVVNFSVAVEQGFGDKTSTGWHNVVAFKDVAEFAEKHLKKGKSVRVSGSLQVRSWDDKQTGQKKYVTELVAHKIDFGDSGAGQKSDAPATRQAAAPPARQQAAPATRQTAPVESDEWGSEIPF